MKFGKHIQKKQLEIHEYAASFVDYKALKKLIKELKNTPVLNAKADPSIEHQPLDAQAALQANNAPFFFRLDRELDKVNAFYKVKEAESKVRLRVLMDKQRSMRMRNPTISKTSTQYITLEQGFRQFIKDLSKLQQFIEINATAFSKILKKWDKTSKSQTKELYLSRAVEVEPCFNRDVISELSDQATTGLLDCAAWAEGDRVQFESDIPEQHTLQTPLLEQKEADSDILEALNSGDIPALRDFLERLGGADNARERFTRAFLSAVSEAPEDALRLLLETNLIDLHYQDEINDRNCLHKAAISGRIFVLQIGLAGHVDVSKADAYGRIPLHYACMNGHVKMTQALIEARRDTVDFQDLDAFTPLIHGIVHSQLGCVQKVLSYSARIDPLRDSDHIPLNLACQYGSLPIVKLLLQGSPHILPDAEGLYPQHLVARSGQTPEILLLLREYGADLDQPDKLYQWTPLFHAASEGRIECLETLITCGVNTAVVDEKGLAALYYATWEGHLECMKTLAAVYKIPPTSSPNTLPPARKSEPVSSLDYAGGPETIPDLELPPPIIPTRRYGHNFLDTKTTVVISFEDLGRNAVTLYDESKYPAARLTIAPRSSDIVPRNLLLPIQEENRNVSFEIDNLNTFSVDFDVYPTFGKKVIAKGSVPSDVFRSTNSSSGSHHLSLLDPRLRCIGQMFFKYQVIKPFHGVPLDITPFATYWKATSQFEQHASTLVTASSLSGEYVRLFVQMSRDGVPILYPYWTINNAGIECPVMGLSYDQFRELGMRQNRSDERSKSLSKITPQNPEITHQILADAFISLQEALSSLPLNIHIELHVIYPTSEVEDKLHLRPAINLNEFADSLLKVVFDHARHLREQPGNATRSIVFTSYHKAVCTALNWKQPNYPVLLCNDLSMSLLPSSDAPNRLQSSGRTSTSIKDAVRIAQNNNFMGLVCSSQVLDLVPALIESIKVAGLVLVSEVDSHENTHIRGSKPLSQAKSAASQFYGIPDGIDGILRSNGVLRFHNTVDR